MNVNLKIMPNIVSLLIRLFDYVKSCIYHIFVSTWLNGQSISHNRDLISSSEVFRDNRDTFFIPLSCLFMRHTVFLPVALVKKANNEGWLRSLAYFVRLKSLYKNNTHYGFTLRSLAARVKCSPGCLSFHLKELNSKGLLRYHDKNVTFIGLDKIKDIDKKPTVIGISVNFKHQYDILRGQIIRLNLSAQKFNIRKHEIQLQRPRVVPHNRTESANSCYTGLSALGVGNLFGLTGATGSRIRKKLDLLGQFRCYRVFSVIMRNISLKQYEDMRWIGTIPIYSRYIDGDIVIQKRMRMEYWGFASELQKSNGN